MRATAQAAAEASASGQGVGKAAQANAASVVCDTHVWVTGLRLEGVGDGLLGEAGLLDTPWPTGSQALGQMFDASGQWPRLVPVADLSALPARLTERYVDEGFGAIRVVVRFNDAKRLQAAEGLGLCAVGELVVAVTENRVKDINVRAPDGGGAVPVGLARMLKHHSPVQRKDPVRLDALNDFVDLMGRHPRRQIGVALSPGNRPGEVDLDYVVRRDKSWLAYMQMANTGTGSAGRWRQQFGYVDYQLSEWDDTLAVSYSTAWFNDTHAFSASYTRPFETDPRWKWQVSADWNMYVADDIGLFNDALKGKGWGVGGELSRVVWQQGPRWVEAFGGLRYKSIASKNTLADLSGQEAFLMPRVGLRYGWNTGSMQSQGSMALETNLPGLAGTDASGMVELGRTGVSDRWWLLRFATSTTWSVNGLFDQGSDATRRAMAVRPEAVVASLQGQWVPGGDRLLPNFTAAAGGLSTVRGHPEVFATGDNAVFGRLAYRFHVPRTFAVDNTESGRTELFGNRFQLKPPYPGGPTDWDWTVQAFLDAGCVWNNHALSFEDDTVLVGAGLGTSVWIKNNLNVSLDWGVVLHEETNGIDRVSPGDQRLHVVVALMF